MGLLSFKMLIASVIHTFMYVHKLGFLMPGHMYIYVTGFDKTRLPRTRTEIQFMV